MLDLWLAVDTSLKAQYDKNHQTRACISLKSPSLQEKRLHCPSIHLLYACHASSGPTRSANHCVLAGHHSIVNLMLVPADTHLLRPPVCGAHTVQPAITLAV